MTQPTQRRRVIWAVVSILLISGLCIIGLMIWLPRYVEQVFDEIASPRCAYVYLDVNGDGQFTHGEDEDLSDSPDFTVTLTGSTGDVLYEGIASGCYYPSEIKDTTVSMVLAVPPGVMVDRPEREITVLQFVQDISPQYFYVTPGAIP
jgi:hypothetical protein